MPRSKGRGRKRKSSSPLDPQETASTGSSATDPQPSLPHPSNGNGGGKYVPRFGSAAKKHKMDPVCKKPNKDSSDEGEEQNHWPVSCTQPAREVVQLGMEEGAGWSSTQPAHCSTLEQVFTYSLAHA